MELPLSMAPPTSLNHFLNPVYPHSCPDPFVLKFCGEYWCYFTGFQSDGRCFGILHSMDLVNWGFVGSALDRLPSSVLPYPDNHYWAPEVDYLNGTFYMYYSVGDETNMQIRVATANHPAGPFVDRGHRLTSEQFAIDAHVFADDDGSRYLFYATDYLDHPRIGTGTAFDRMVDPFTLAGQPRPVTRARFDWQIYDPSRTEKEGACWHTLEGPFVLKYNACYYQMFSGGNWQNDTYGVAYGLTDRLDLSVEWEQPCDGETTKPVLHSQPKKGIIGPGHNSVVRGPDNQTLYCVYHRWQPETSERVLAIDRLFWEGNDLKIAGPSSSSQPVPPLPDIAGFSEFTIAEFESNPLRDDELHLAPDQSATLFVSETETSALEVSFRSLSAVNNACLHVELFHTDCDRARIRIFPGRKAIEITIGDRRLDQPLLARFNHAVFHLLRVEVISARMRILVDGCPLFTEA